MNDFRKGFSMFQANTAEVDDSIDLEIIPGGPSGFAPGMVINYAKWDSLYCVIKRDDWTEHDYYNYAKKRLKDLGVTRP